MKAFRFFALWALVSIAGAQTYYEKSTVPPLPPKSPTLYATSYGACTWDATHDVSACINAAITKAVASGGGTIIVPCGTYGVSSQILQQTSGVHLQGCGNGTPRSGVDTSKFLAATRLKWIGAGTSNPVLLVGTAAGGGSTSYSVDVIGITVDCDNICDTAIRISGAVFSRFNIGGAEAIKANIEFTTPTDLAGGGNQHNDIWAYSRSTSASNSPTGILIDAGCLSCFNTSYNIFHELFAWYRKGDGIVFGGSDNNTVEFLNDFPNTGATGSAVVFANSAYTPPSGVAVNQYSRAIRVLHTGSHGVHITGFQTNSTFTAAGGNGGTAALAPLTIATSAGSAQSTSTLTFASTTGAANGETVSCGGPVNGMFNGTPVGNVTSTTVSIGLAQFISAVPISTNCVFTYGVNSSAVAGSYTLTATPNGTTYTLTAPAGGHTQTGITASGGFLTFTDMLIPWTGTANTNDSWTIVVPTASNAIAIEFIDKENNLAAPTFEYGSNGYFSQTNKGYPVVFNQSCVIANSATGTSSGTSACVFGGESNTASGEASVTLGGTGLASTGFAATTIGQNNTSTGVDSFVHGARGTDRGKFAADCLGGGQFVTQGDSQTCTEILQGTGATGSAIRLTSDGLTAGTINCMNLPNNTVFELKMEIVAFDHTTITNFASWNDISGLLTRGANAASTAVALVSAAPPVSFSGGTLTGNAMSITADTINGCLNISWTPPTSNTDTWNVVARVQTVEVQ